MPPTSASAANPPPRSPATSAPTSAPEQCNLEDQLTQRYRDGSAADSDAPPVLQPPSYSFDVEKDQKRWNEGATGDASHRQADQPSEIDERPSYGTMAYAQQVFAKEGWMPALESEQEGERRRMLRRYRLHEAERVVAIDDLSQLVRDVFGCEAVMINIVFEDHVLFISTSGWEQDEATKTCSGSLRKSFCSHTPAGSGCFVLEDVQQDWRFANSPLAKKDGSSGQADEAGRIAFFASANIDLPNIAAPTSKHKALPVGSLCLIDSKPRSLDEAQRRMLQRFAKMAAKEFQLAYHAKQSAMTERRADYTAELFRSLLVYPSRTTVKHRVEEHLATDSVAATLVDLTNSDFAFILDLRSFNNPTPNIGTGVPRKPRERRSSWQGRNGPNGWESAKEGVERVQASTGSSRRDARVHGLGSIGVLDSWCRDRKMGKAGGDEVERWKKLLTSNTGLEAVSNALLAYHETGQVSTTLPLRRGDGTELSTPFLPLIPDGATALASVPIFDHEGEPALYVVIGSRQGHAFFEPPDERFITGIGTILLSALLQEKILAADQAKLAFLSQVSHEVRLPLFSIAGNLDLIRTTTDSSPELSATLAPYIDVAAVCLETLRDVLDDCLEYSKLSNASSGAQPPKPKKTACQLETLVVDVVKSCMHKVRHREALREQEESTVPEEELAINLVSDLPTGMEAMVDAGGLKRVLLNLFGNAMKFTLRGGVTVRLSEPPIQLNTALLNGLRPIRFEIIDSGRGMSPEFLRDSLFTAFRQEDSFSNGAGLGVSLASQLVSRMDGRINYESEVGIGTTASFTIPLEILPSSSVTPPQSPPSLRTRDLRVEFVMSFGAPHGPSTDASSSASSTLPRPASNRPTSFRNSPLSTIAIDHANRGSVTDEQQQSMDRRVHHAVQVMKRVASDEADRKQVEEREDEVESPKANRVARDRQLPSSSIEKKQRLRCLVVDDNELARRVLTTFLKTRGYEWAEASGGAQAIERFKSFRPHVVWCDVEMPVVDGIAASREMRRWEAEQKWPRCKIIAVSGLDEDPVKSGQFDRWIVKGGTSLRSLTTDLAESAASYAKDHPSVSDSPPLGEVPPS
ncbi:hypothetical protein JCM11641_008359 [Rhodosporidiobolus odoratus]